MGNNTTTSDEAAGGEGGGGSSHAISNETPTVAEGGGGGGGGPGEGGNDAAPAQAEAAALGAIIMDDTRPARLDALKSILSFLTPGEVQAFLDSAIAPAEQPFFEGLRQEVMQERLQQVFSDDPEAQHKGLVELRRLVCATKNTPYECGAVIRAGLVPKIITFLDHAEPRLQVEAAWLLTNLSSGTSEHTAIVVSHDAIPPLVRLLASDNTEVVTQSAWALGNIAGDNGKHRDLVLLHGAIHPLLQTWTPQRDVASLRTTVWVLTNLVNRKQLYDFHREGWTDVPFVVSRLGWLFQHVDDKEVICDASWALRSLLSNRPGVGRPEMIERVCSMGIGNALLVAMINALSSGVRRHAEILVSKLTMGGYDRNAYPHTWSFCKRALPVLTMKGEHRLFKVRQYCTFATANLLAPLEDRTERDDDAPIPHAPNHVYDAVSLLLDHIYPPAYPHPLSPEDAEEEANKTPEQRQEERANLEHQEREVGEDLRLEAAWALKRVLQDSSRCGRLLTYHVMFAREGLVRIVQRLTQQAQATAKGKKGRRLSGEGKQRQEEEKGGGKIGLEHGDTSGGCNSKKPAYEPRGHAGLVLALLECLDTLISAPIPSDEVSSSPLSVTATTAASATVLQTDGGSDDGSHHEQNYDNQDEAEVNPAPVAAAGLTSTMAAAAIQARARTLDRMTVSEKHVRGSKGGKEMVFDPYLLKASEDEVEGAEAGVFARAVLPVLAALEGKFASTSVKRKLMVLKEKVDELMVVMKGGEKQETETN